MLYWLTAAFDILGKSMNKDALKSNLKLDIQKNFNFLIIKVVQILPSK